LWVGPTLSSGTHTVSLIYPTTRPGKRITDLAGEAEIVWPARLMSAELPEPVDGQSFEIPNAVVTLERVIQVPGTAVEMQLSLKRTGGTDAEWAQLSTLFTSEFPRTLLSGGDGFSTVGQIGRIRRAKDEVGAWLHFYPLRHKAGPTTLRIEVPLEMRALTAKFEFTDVPMP
jgi:hypothetical protein